MPSRRHFLTAGGLALAGFAVPVRLRAARPVDIKMVASPRGEHVSFDPLGVRIEPGQTVRWIMASPGNPHTSTAYHPSNANHSLRIPAAAAPWDSGFLVEPGAVFEVTLTVEGVYDYFCIPHEHAGMVGRIVVGRSDTQAGADAQAGTDTLPEIALRAFPAVDDILRRGIIRRM